MAEGRTKHPPVADDWFVEPPAATRFLLQRESFDGLWIWDPACGQGNIVKVCLAAGLAALGSDLRGGREGFAAPAADFMAPSIVEPRDVVDGHGSCAIICNPPYGRAKLAEAFIRKAVGMAQARKVCMFVNAKFLFGQARAKGLFKELPPTRIYPVLPRPSCPPGVGLAAGTIEAKRGVENFVWMVWDRAGPRNDALGARSEWQWW